eukprot:g12399.t1
MPNESTAHDKRLVALLAGAAAASAAVLLLHRRRRLRREAEGGLDGRDGTQRNVNGARHTSYLSDDFNNARLPPRYVHVKSCSSGSLSDTYPAVDIGAVLGVDIGGTLSKLVYFEKKAPSKADSKRRPSEDPMGKKVEMKRTVSLGNLHDTMEQQEALNEFYTFMDQASAGKDSGVKDAHLSVYSHALGGVLHFFHFETRFMDHAVEVLGNSSIHRNIQALGCTGGGAFKFEESFMQRLGVRMLQMDEMECLVRGMQFALANIPEACYTYRPPVEVQEAVPSPPPAEQGEGGQGAGVGLDGDEPGPDPRDNIRNKRMRQMAEVSVKREYTVKVGRAIADEPVTTAYPALLVSLGSGVSIIKVDGPAVFKRVSGSSIGGGTYWGLARLLTGATSYDESLDMASRGDSDKVDMLVGDIYGRDYSKFQLSSNTLASSFGKVGGMKAPGAPGSGVEAEDLARSLLVMITMNIGQVAYQNAKLFNTRRIYFVGNFLRHNHLSGQQLAFAIDYWSSGEMEALFLEHEGYCGALGSFLMDSFESESPSEEEEEDGQATPPSKQRPSHASKSASSATSERRNRRRARKDRSELGKRNVEIEKKGKKASGSYGSGSQSAGSSNNTKTSRLTIRVGDSVVVYLPSGGKAKGTVSRESSRDRYEVTLENGNVEKRVHSRNIALDRRHRHEPRNRRDEDERTRTSTSRFHQQKKKMGSLRRQESRHEALGRQDRVHEARDCQDSVHETLDHQDSVHEALDRQASVHDALLSESESGSPTPRDQNHGSSVSAGVGIGSPPSSSAEAQQESAVVGGDGPPSPISQGLSTTTSAASGGCDPAQQPPEVESHSPDAAAPNTGQTLALIEAPGSESEPATPNGERGSPSERRSSSPLSSRVRQAQGLLRTIFWKKGGEQAGDSSTQRERRSNSVSRRWPRGNSLSRRFSKGSDGRGARESSRFAHTHPGGEDEGEDLITDKLDPPSPTSEHSGDAASTSPGATTLKCQAQRISQGLTRGRSRSRKRSEAGPSGASESPASRSPSLAAKLGMTLRGAVMGTTQLGVHKPHVDRHTQAADGSKYPSSGGSDADGASDATYSTGASTKERLARRERRGSRRKSSAAGGVEGHGGHSSDGFGSDVFGQGSPLAPTTPHGGDPRSFPDAVHSYIDARERMEHEMSASGPAFLPCVDSLAANSAADGAIKGWGKRRGSLDITKQASSTTQRTEQHQPFTEAMFKAGISETKHSTKQGILLEGDLQKFSPESVRGVRWHKRYFVLYACSCELRYYRTHAEAAWGRIPLGERGSIPLRLVVKIEQPSDKKYRGCRFDLIVLHRGDSRHPGLGIRPGQESRVCTTKTFRLNAADAQQRLLWVTVIEALMKKHGWGLDADRCRGTGAPRHGGPAADTGDSLCWGSTWDGQAAGTGSTARPREAAWLDNNGSKTNAGELEGEFSSPRTTGWGQHDPREAATGENPAASRKGSVMMMNFVEEQDDRKPCIRQDDNRAFTLPAQQQRGLRIPYSPGGKRGSLTTGALSPPVVRSGGARRQSSLKSHLRL